MENMVIRTIGNEEKVHLLSMAWEARDQAYAPYSSFKVGAAVLCRDGAMFGGCNVENISFGLTLCAERAAAVAAVAAGRRDIVAAAVVAHTVCPIVPCGACRQFLAEFNPEMTVFSANSEVGNEWKLNLLLPLPKTGILESNAPRGTK